MKKELDEKLVKDFPKLFKDRYESEYKTAMCWGFECGDGWEPLIRRCAEKLEKLNDSMENSEDYIVASQVKEKFGTLRFYTESYPLDLSIQYNEAINTAETESSVTCEKCGNPGETLYLYGWFRTVCKDHS